MLTIAPSKTPLNNPTQHTVQAVDCNANATAAMNTQPDTKPGFQDYLDAFYGAVAGYLTGGTAKAAATGAAVGLSAQSVGHTLQQGWAYQAALNSCFGVGGVNTGNFPF